jgi:ArsR family transcriptional regulator
MAGAGIETAIAVISADLLGCRKEGPNVIYYVADESIFELCDHVCSSLQKRLAEQARTFAADR